MTRAILMAVATAILCLGLPLGAFVAVTELLAKEGIAPSQSLRALWPLPILFGLYLAAWCQATWRQRLAKALGPHKPLALLISAGMVLIYFPYAMAGAGLAAPNLGLVLPFWGALALWAYLARRHQQGFGVWDAVLIVFLWANVEFQTLAPAYAWPKDQGGVFVLFGATLWVMCYYENDRRMPGVHASMALSRQELRVVLRETISLLALAIPLGLASGFITWQGLTQISSWHAPLSTAIMVFFLIALPEELLFRALLHNALNQWLGRPGLALAISSVLFGLTHLNNGPAPDWRYVALASLAGWFYGRAYKRTGNVTAPALVHMAVDTIWTSFFHSPSQ